MKEFPVSPDGFVNMLVTLDKGIVVQELDDELIKGLQALGDFGGSATITLKITLKKIPGMDAAINIHNDVITKFPKEDRRHTSMFKVGGNGLVAQYQDQPPLEGLGNPVNPPATTLQSIPKKKGK